ncbi:MAG: hypothetical protein QOH16_3903 [Gaiellaceae bacterium]|nr:hypothetical protein [Gaiellaceae bacterium]
MARGTGGNNRSAGGTPRARLAAENARPGGEPTPLEQAALLVVARFEGSGITDITSLRMSVGASSPVSDAHVQIFVARKLDAAWQENPQQFAAGLLGAAQLALPSGGRRNRPRYQDIVTYDDWRQLCAEKLARLPHWTEIDWSVWLNGLIRSRCETSDRQPEGAAVGTGQGNSWVTDIPRRTAILR